MLKQTLEVTSSNPRACLTIGKRIIQNISTLSVNCRNCEPGDLFKFALYAWTFFFVNFYSECSPQYLRSDEGAALKGDYFISEKY